MKKRAFLAAGMSCSCVVLAQPAPVGALCGDTFGVVTQSADSLKKVVERMPENWHQVDEPISVSQHTFTLFYYCPAEKTIGQSADQLVAQLQSQFPQIRYMQPVTPPQEEFDSIIEAVLLEDDEQTANDPSYSIDSFWQHGYWGQGLAIGILDSGVDSHMGAFHQMHYLTKPNPSMEEELTRTQLSRWMRSPHGSAVASVAAGRVRDGGEQVGIAPEASVVFAFAGDVPIKPTDPDYAAENPRANYLTLADLYQLAQQVDVVNYSFGHGRIRYPDMSEINPFTEGDYGFYARFFDAVAHENNILYVKSAGNEGHKNHLGEKPQPYQAFPYSLTRVAEGFNGLTVANIETVTTKEASTDAPFPLLPLKPMVDKNVQRHTHPLRFSSSRGPTTGGRKKPDLAAPGQMILAATPIPSYYFARGNCLFDDNYGGRFEQNFRLSANYFKFYDCEKNLRYASGTSIAAPVVAGAATLVQQALQDYFGRSDVLTDVPSVVKAILINSADNSSDHLLPETDPLSEFCDAQHNWCPSAGWGYLNMTQAYKEYRYVQQHAFTEQQQPAWFMLDLAQVKQLEQLKVTAVWRQTEFAQENGIYPAKLTLWKKVGQQRAVPYIRDDGDRINNVLQVREQVVDRQAAYFVAVSLLSPKNAQQKPIISLSANVPLIPVNGLH